MTSFACGDDGACPASGTCGSKSESTARTAGDAGSWKPQPAPSDTPDAAMSTPTLINTCEASAETCNAIDDDCDGKVDEASDVTCYPSGTMGCSDGACSGACALGKRVCVDGKLGECNGAITPRDEQCTGTDSETSIDEDCDGKVDESCSCTGSQISACYTAGADTLGVGPCKAGVKTCQNGMFSGCANVVTPQLETCGNEGSDDDCDGMIDDIRNLGEPCNVDDNQGVCKHGTLQCAGDGNDLHCLTTMPSTEVCNGIDDDCNGVVDDGFDLTSRQHCGSCDNHCESGSECCDGHCVDTQGVDVNNCGACGTVCSSGAQPGCCGGSCVDLLTDTTCGRCDNACGLFKLGGGFLCHCQMVEDGPNCVGNAVGQALQVCR